MHVIAHIVQIGDRDRHIDEVIDRAHMWADEAFVTVVPWELIDPSAHMGSDPWSQFFQLIPGGDDVWVVGLTGGEVVVEAESVRPTLRSFPDEPLAFTVYFMASELDYVKSGIVGPSNVVRAAPWYQAARASRSDTTPGPWLAAPVRSGSRLVPISTLDYTFSHEEDRRILDERAGVRLALHHTNTVPWFRGGLLRVS